MPRRRTLYERKVRGIENAPRHADNATDAAGAAARRQQFAVNETARGMAHDAMRRTTKRKVTRR